MKLLAFLSILFFCACKNSTTTNSVPPITDTVIARDTIVANTDSKIDKEKFYTNKDTIIISTLNNDTVKYSEKDFNDIVDNFPALYSNYPDPPDITFQSSKNFADIIDSSGNTNHVSFTSECGQDVYYTLYAYFLKQKNGEKKYAVRRKTLIEIFNRINSIFGRLSYGGTYFGHQYPRIEAYAEYGVYWYSKRDDFFTKTYDIAKQKELYISGLKQIIIDEESIDYNTIDKKEKLNRRKELFKMVDEISSLVTDNFYLKMAQGFHYEHY